MYLVKLDDSIAQSTQFERNIQDTFSEEFLRVHVCFHVTSALSPWNESCWGFGGLILNIV